MSVRCVLASAVFACAIAATPSGFASDNNPDAVGDAWVKAVTAGDLDGVMKLYADDAVAWFPDEAEHQGGAAIRAAYKNWFDTYTINSAALTNRHSEGDGKHQAHWGNFTMTVTQKSDGKSMTWTGRYTDVTELRKGHWMYIADHASADPPPKPAAAPATTAK